MFTQEEKKRLAFLRMKAASQLTSDEITELQSLTAKAAEAKIELNESFDKEFGEKSTDDIQDGEVSDVQLKQLITDAVKAAKDGDSTEQTEAITKSISEALKGKSFNSSEVEGLLKKHLAENKVDETKILDGIKSLLEQNKETFTKEDVKKMVADAVAENAKSASRMEHPMSIHAPIEHRAGNMTVAQKQLLNICLMNVSKEAFENGSKRPEHMNDGIDAKQLSLSVASGKQLIARAREEARYGGKSLLTSSAGSGQEWMPSDLSSDLQARLYLESALATELIGSEVDMPTNPYSFPLKTTRTQFFTGAEGVAGTESQMGTGDIILNAKKLIGTSSYSYESDEDAIIPILSTIQEDMAEGAAAAFEDAILNGDTAATHQDSDVDGVTNHHNKLLDGLRKRILASALGSISVDLSTGGISTANLLAMKAAAGKYGIKPSDLMFVCGVAGYNTMLGLDETLTVDKVGNNQARILTGMNPSFYGIPVIYSEAVREDLNASGVYDGVTTTKGSIFLVNKKSWMVGVRRGFTVEVDVNKLKQLNYVIASFRRDFIPKDNLDTQPLAVMGYNF